MEETAPENNAVSNEQVSDPLSSIPAKPFHVPFNEMELPLGQHFEQFWQDFVDGDLPNDVVKRLDGRAKKYRSAYAETQAKGISIYLADIRITLLVTFDDRPEEWEVEL